MTQNKEKINFRGHANWKVCFFDETLNWTRIENGFRRLFATKV